MIVDIERKRERERGEFGPIFLRKSLGPCLMMQIITDTLDVKLG